MTTLPTYLDYAGAAEVLGISPRTLRNWVSLGRRGKRPPVPHRKIGGAVRFTPQDLRDIACDGNAEGGQL